MITLTIFLKQMAFAVDFMHSMGKMYVVVAVVTLVLVGLFIYLSYLDRRISRMENQIRNKNG